MIRKLGIGLTVALAVSALSGCDDPKPTPPATNVTVTSPADGATLTLRDDVANDQAGLQIDVRGDATGFGAAAVARLRIDGAETELQVPVAGTSFSFPSVSLQAGARVLTVAVSDGTASGEASASVVVDDDPLPDSLEIASPASGTTLNAAADASPGEEGLQTEVTLKSVMLSGGTVRLCLTAEGFTGSGACKSAQGQVLAEAPLAANGTTTLSVSLPEGVEMALAAEWEREGFDAVVAQPVTVTVDTVAPALSFVVPVEGEVRTEQSFDVTLQTDAEAGQVATVVSSALEGETFEGAAAEDGSITVHVTLPIGAQTLTANLLDKAGNPAEPATVGFTVDVAGCDVQLSDPAGTRFVFNTLNSQVSGTSGTYTLVGHTNACAGGTVHFTKTVDGTATELGTVVADENGDFSYAATFEDGEIDATLNVKVEGDLAPNDGLDLTYTADFSSPVVTFVSPTDGQTIASQATSIEVSVAGAEEGQVVTFKSGPTEIGTAAVDASGTARVNVNLALGAQTLSAEVSDAAGNPGSASVQVLVDIAGCEVTLTAPTAANVVVNLANATVDESATPRTGTFTVTGTTANCAGGLARFTKTVGGTTTELGTAQVDASGAFSYAAGLVDGETDAQLNVKVENNLAPNAGVTFTYTADFTAPAISFVSPVDGATVTSLTTTVEVAVTGAEAGRTVTFKLGANTLGTAQLDASGHASASVNLPLGALTLEAEVADAAGNPASTSIQVVVDTDGCDTVLTNPTTSNVVFNLANATVDQSATPRTGTFTITGTTTRCAGGTARFTKTVGASSTEIGTAAVDASGNFSFAATFVDGEDGATVNVKVENNLAPNAGATFSYRADFTAPAIAFTSPLDGETVTSVTPTLTVSVTGAEQGQTVTFKSGSSVLGSGTVDAAGVASANVNLSLGAQSLSAEVADAAGNPASTSIQVLVDTAGCDVALTNPASASYVFNLANSTVTAGTPKTGTFTLTGATTLCAGGTARFTKTVGATSTEIGTAAVDASGNFSFEATFDDGEADATLNIKVEKNLAPNAGIDLAYSADFTAPTLDTVAPPQGDLYIVHASNPRLIAGEAGYVADADAASAGGQLDLSLLVSGIGTISSAGQGRAVVALGSTELFRQTYTSNAQQDLSQRLTLPEGYSGPMTVTLTDAAGNGASGTWNARVATVALPTPTITLPSAGTVNVFRDLGGDRATYAVVQGNVNYGATAPAGSQIRVCSTIQLAGGAACAQAGYFELPNTNLTTSGTGQFYAALRLPQGVQTISAELTDAAGNLSTSATVALTVDTVPPVVTSLAMVEDANHDGLLTGAELPAGQAAHFTAQVTGVSNGRAINLFDGTTQIASSTVSSGSASFTVNSLGDGAHTFKALLTDGAGNPNEASNVTPPITNTTAALALNVKRVAPSISVVTPTFGMCNASRDKVLATPECEIDFTVLVGSGATRVDFTGPGNPSPSSVTSFTDGRATATYSLAQGGPFTLVATVSDSAGNTRPISVTLSVDTVPPTLAFTSPADGTILSSQRFPVSLSTTAEVGQTVTVKSGATQVGTGVVAAGGVATFNVDVGNGSQTLTATVSDAAGNPAVPATLDIEVNVDGCDVNFTNPTGTAVVFNKASTPTGEVTIAGNTTRAGCEGQEVRFYAAVNGAAETLVGTRTVDASGNFSMPYTFGDGTVTVISAEITFGATTNRSSFTATTDLTPPTLTINSPTPDSNDALFVVAKDGNVNVRDGVAGYVPDADTAANGQVNFDISVTGGGSFNGTADGRLVIMQGATEVASEVISSNGSVSFNPLSVTFTQAFVGPLTLMVTDSVGNSVGASWDLTVDVVAPESPSFVLADPGNGAFTRVVDERAADLDVFVSSPSDDGPAYSLACEMGYTTIRRLGATAIDESSFDNAALVSTIALGDVTSPGASLGHQFRSIAPLNTYPIATRCTDQVGNASPLATHSVSLMWSTHLEDYSGTGTSPLFGAYVSVGDIDRDGNPDIAVGAPSEDNNRGSVMVYYGGSMPFARTQRFSGNASGDYFGAPFELWDMNGDGRSDLVTYNYDKLEVYLASASTGGLETSPSITITGDMSILYMKRVGDLNGDGLADLALSNPYYAGKGRVYLLFAKTDWSSFGGVVPITSAAVIVSAVSTGALLGTGNGMVSIPDFDGDGKGELLLGSSGEKKAYLFRGATLTGSVTTAASTRVFSVTAGTKFGFAGASVDVDADGLSDIVISDPSRSTLYWIRQSSAGTFAAAPVVLATGTGSLGWDLTTGDLNMDGKPDLVAGGNSTSDPSVSVFWSGSAGISVPAASVVSGGGGFGTTIAAANLNGDSADDLVVGECANGDGSFKVYY